MTARRVVRPGSQEVREGLDRIDLTGTLHEAFLRGPRNRVPTGVRAHAGVMTLRRNAFEWELPLEVHRALRSAGLVALLGRYLLVPSVITASVVGRAPATQWYISVLASHLPGISEIAVDGERFSLAPWVKDDLYLNGVGLVLTVTEPEAVRGSTLVVARDGTLGRLGQAAFARGSVLVDIDGPAIPPELLQKVDRVMHSEDTERMLGRAVAGHGDPDEIVVVQPLNQEVLGCLDVLLAGELLGALSES